MSFRNTAYFLSDVHLGVNTPQSDPDRYSKLLALLESWKADASHIVLVGDIFEFWWESQYFVPSKYFQLYHILHELVKSGVDITFIPGNHDFAMGNFFRKELGIRVEKRWFTEIQGKRMVFLHGDGLAASDRYYRIARKIIDFPLNRFLYGLLPMDWGMKLALKVGSTSRKYTEKEDPKLAEYQKAAKRLLKRKNLDIFVQGHNHTPDILTWDEGLYVNCGNWMNPKSYVRMQNGVPQLVVLDSGELK